eukprot:gene9598-9761_t
MQVAPNSDGIQKLLAAEQEASRIVAEARKAKAERLRQAKADAEREIAQYRAEREGAYQKKLSESSTGAASTLERMSKETEANIAQVHADVAAKKSQVVDLIVKYVTAVQL